MMFPNKSLMISLPLTIAESSDCNFCDIVIDEIYFIFI